MANEHMNRDFKGVWIPKDLYLDPDLSWSEKILIIEIDSLDRDDEKGCWKSNADLAAFLQLSEGRVANMISELRAKGWIRHLWFNGRNRGLSTKLRETRLHKNVNADFTETGKQQSRKGEDSLNENVGSILSNTDNNTKSNTPLSHGRKAMILVNDNLGERIDEMIVWLKNKRSMHHLSPQSYHDLFAELDKYGIPLDRFKEYYEWLEKQKWVKGAIGVKLLGSENSIESYLNREKLAARAAEGENNGKRRIGYGTSRAILEKRRIG